MYLTPFDNDAIYYNATTFDASSLATIFLLAFAYHPTYLNLLYLLYGSTSLASNGNLYGNINIMVRDTTAKLFLQNSTITDNIQCLIQCEIKVTDSLFLIQSSTMIYIYRVNSNNLVNVSAVAGMPKEPEEHIIGIRRQGDILKNKFVLNHDIAFFFGYVTETEVIQKSFYENGLGNALSVLMTEKQLFFAAYYDNLMITIYECISCLFNGTLSPKIIAPTNTSISKSYRLYHGIKTQESNISNPYVFIGIGDGITRKYHINQSAYWSIIVSSDSGVSQSEANCYYYLTYGSSLLTFRQFASNQSDQNAVYFSFSSAVKVASISSDSTLVAISTGKNTWNIQQYQIGCNCSQFNTNNSNSTNNSTNSSTNSTQLCACARYDNQQLCKNSTDANSTNANSTNANSTDTSTASSSGSFPITTIVSVIAGVAIIAVSAIVIKKNYKRCLKRHRTPWKYDPVQLMSFEI